MLSTLTTVILLMTTAYEYLSGDSLLIRKYRSILGSMFFLMLVFGIDIVLFVTCWLVYIISARYSRKLNSEYVQMMFLHGSSYIFPPCKIIYTGDEISNKSDQSIVIANHQVDADWWFSWSFLRSQGVGGYVKFIMKKEIGNIPIVGWGLKGLNFIMLQRNWEKDEKFLLRQLETFIKDKAPLQLLIFPEGTTVNTTSKEKSKAFMEKQGRHDYVNLLSPRTTGFNACLRCLEGQSNGFVYDLTIAYESYSGEIPTWEMGYDRSKDLKIPSIDKLLQNKNGDYTAHIHVEAHSLEEARRGGQLWLYDVWSRKDKLLEEFIKNGKFPGEARRIENRREKCPFFIIGFGMSMVFTYLVMILAEKAVERFSF